MPEKAGPVGLYRPVQEIKQALKAEGYECFTGTADLYVYYFECACICFVPQERWRAF